MEEEVKDLELISQRADVTETMNQVCDEIGGDVDSFVAAASQRILERVEW